MEALGIAAFALSGAIMNRVRGSLGQPGKLANDAAFGVATGLATQSVPLALTMALVMLLGRTMRWSILIRRFYAGMILEGIALMSARGLLWTALLGIPLFYWDYAGWFWVVYTGILMGPIYAAGIVTLPPRWGWPAAEVMWGAVLWAVVGMVLIL